MSGPQRRAVHRLQIGVGIILAILLFILVRTAFDAFTDLAQGLTATYEPTRVVP